MIFFYLQEEICHYKLFRTHQRRPQRAPVRLLRRQGGPAPQPVPLDSASPLVLLIFVDVLFRAVSTSAEFGRGFGLLASEDLFLAACAQVKHPTAVQWLGDSN
ncbi:hypothetical protein PVAP13_8KG253802 [Panicum virgatum]|uniref:Uncharacterized protein n=1 Tax=Panicum virgatum TaxID=38727 RepID=A0A8T0PJS3_PANVG|nr:hypothetical protein PVAP13_8KG253802 [Panicum virgatum]